MNVFYVFFKGMRPLSTEVTVRALVGSLSCVPEHVPPNVVRPLACELTVWALVDSAHVLLLVRDHNLVGLARAIAVFS